MTTTRRQRYLSETNKTSPRIPSRREEARGPAPGSPGFTPETAIVSPRYPKLLDMLAERDRAFLLARAAKRTITRGQLLYHQGDPSENVYIVLKGIIKILYLSGGGYSFTTTYYREGMVVGAHGCTEWAGNHSWSAESVVDSEVLCLKRTDLIELSDASPEALKCLLAISEFKSEQLKRVIKILATPRLEERIFIALRSIGDLYGVKRDGGIEISEQFTRQEIAEMMGASRQSVTMLMLALEKSGQIRRNGRKIFIRTE